MKPLCNGLDAIVAQALAIGPNAHGLIGTFAEARKCAEYLPRADVGAEPGLWISWLIIDHTANRRDVT